MGIVMAGLSPHPPIIIPEVGGERRLEARKTIEGLEELAEEIVATEPEVLITISPHGPVFRDGISVIDQSRARGDFGEFGHPEVEFSEDINLEFIEKLREYSDREGYELISLRDGESVSAGLDHGVLVPLYYLEQAGFDAPIVPLTMGLLDYGQLYSFGQIIQGVVEELSVKSVILTSGDLSHRLKPGAPAGFNPRGQEFDEKLVELIEDRRFEEILRLDPQLIEKAGECGLRPLIIMLGSLDGLEIRTEVKSYEGPFGVGYAVASFKIKGVD